ncbi:MAG: cob(I)yrinic acid a,c-diamide adenosyltransferase [Clostridium sp.]
MGCVHIYCGDGKGKTTAAVGLAVRMAGYDEPVILARFLKNDESGEVAALSHLPSVEVLPCSRSFGFTWQMSDAQKAEAADYYKDFLNDALNRVTQKAGGQESDDGPTVLLILDEICAAINSGLVQERQVLDFLDTRPEHTEVVLTGRNPSEELMKRADYISEIQKQKHPFDGGTAARKGIEY